MNKDKFGIKVIFLAIFMVLSILSCKNSVNNPQNNNNGNNGLSAPQHITAQTLSSTSVKITWTTVSGAYQYLIYRSVTSTGLPTPIDYTYENNYVDIDLIPNEKYFYRVAAIDSDFNPGASSKYVEATTDMPQAPSKPSAQGLTSTQIRVLWTTVPGAVKYQIFRCVTAEGDYGNIPLAETEENTYLDSGLQPDSTYYYKVIAVTRNGTISPMSDYAQGKTPDASSAELLPEVPLNINATAQSASSILISWSPVAGVSSYVIYRGSSVRGSSLTTTFTDTGLSAGTSYTYSVSAVNSAGEGPLSASATAKTSSATYVVTFDSAGGTSVSSQNVVSGNKATKPTNPTRAGYDFVEWQRSGATFNFATAITSNTTLTAKWTLKTIAAPVISGITMTSDYNGYRVAWAAISGAESYRIYKSNSKSGVFNYLGAVTTTYFDDKTTGIMQAGTSSFYQITAFKKDQGTFDIESVKSTARGVTTTNPKIRVTSTIGFSTTGGCSEVIISIGSMIFTFPTPSILTDYKEINPGAYTSVSAYGKYQNPNSGGYNVSATTSYGARTFYVNTSYTFSGGSTGTISSSSHLTMQ